MSLELVEKSKWRIEGPFDTEPSISLSLLLRVSGFGVVTEVLEDLFMKFVLPIRN